MQMRVSILFEHFLFATSRWIGDPDTKIYLAEATYNFTGRNFSVVVTLQD